MRIYLDLTFALNFLLCFIILFCHEIIFNNKIPLFRKILASVIGSGYSVLMIIYPRADGFLLKFFIFLLVSLVCFKFYSLEYFIKRVISLLVLSFIAAGLLYWFMFEKKGNFYMVNPMVDLGKINKLFIFLFGLVILIPLVRVFIFNIKSLFNNPNLLYKIEVIIGESRVLLKGFVDTGNSLYDPVSKLPVIIVNSVKLKGLLGEKWDQWLEKGEIWDIPMDSEYKVCFVPFKSMGGEEIMIAIKPDKIFIHNDLGQHPAHCLIGLNLKNKRMHPGVDALIHPSIVT